MRTTLQPHDTFWVSVKRMPSREEKASLALLYQPIMGAAAYSLYQTLSSWAEVQRGQAAEHRWLLALLGLPPKELIEARHRLEGLGLMQTWVQPDPQQHAAYHYHLFHPLDPQSFFADSALSRMLYQQLGERLYLELSQALQPALSPPEHWQEITRSFTSVYPSLESGPAPPVPAASREEESRSKPAPEPMSEEERRRRHREDLERLSPYDVLQAYHEGSKVAESDMRLVRTLLEDYQLPPGVVNVLLEYVMFTNNYRLPRKLVETIAGHWRRLKVKSVDEALALCKQEHRMYRSWPAQGGKLPGQVSTRYVRRKPLPASLRKPAAVHPASPSDEKEQERLRREKEALTLSLLRALGEID